MTSLERPLSDGTGGSSPVNDKAHSAGGGLGTKKKRLKSVLVTARGRQEGSPNLNYIWLLKECLITVQALQISACSGDLARTELHPIIKASRGLWFHRFREI